MWLTWALQPDFAWSEAFGGSQWETLVKNIDYNTFRKLPAVVGCPDCADGGAEWLEVRLTDGTLHKVTYEYGIEPVDIPAT